MAKDTDRERLELLQGTLDMLILRTLQWGPRHGHGIGQTIRTQSDGLLKVETGSLYPALHRHEDDPRHHTACKEQKVKRSQSPVGWRKAHNEKHE